MRGPTIRCCCSASLRRWASSRSRAIFDEIPPLADFEPFGVYCGWEITLSSTTASEASIREVFEFVEGNCDLEIVQLIATTVLPTPPRAPVQKTADTFDALPRCGAVRHRRPRESGRLRPSRRFSLRQLMPEPEPEPRRFFGPLEPGPVAEAPAPAAGPRSRSARRRARPPQRDLVDPRRSRQGRPRGQHGGRAGHHPVDADPADG